MDVVLQVGVKALIKSREGKYLMVKRSVAKYPTSAGKGSWDIVGGRIVPGTALLENLKREIKEETGLDLAGEPTLIGAQDILHVPGKHIVRLTYVAEATGEVVLDPVELDDHKWMEMEEIEMHEDTDIYFKELVKRGMLQTWKK